MQELPRADEMALTDAAMRIKASYQAARAMLLRGELRGRRVGRLFYVEIADVERLERQRAEAGPVAQPA